MQLDLRSLGIDPVKGGACIIVAGEVGEIGSITDEESGEVKTMVPFAWMGGTHYIMCDRSSPIAQLPQGEFQAVLIPQAKGKKGWYQKGQPRVLELGKSGPPAEFAKPGSKAGAA